MDRTLTYAKHVTKVKAKVATRNNLLGKLANSRWGADPHTLRTTALALSYSAAEYCSPVWGRSSHAKEVDPELNNACRIITGTLRPTPLTTVYKLAGIAPPHIRRETQAMTEKYKQEQDARHPLFEHSGTRGRLKSRKSFATCNSLNPESSSVYRLGRWREWNAESNNISRPEPNERLPSGTELSRPEWVTINRARAKVGRTQSNLYKWKLAGSAECQCGHPSQTMNHILEECKLGPHCTEEDLWENNEFAQNWIKYWCDKI